MTPNELALEIFPDADDAFLEHAIWARTGFPAFFHLQEGQTIEEKMREQLIEYRDTLARMRPGDQLCDHCNNLALPDMWECFGCGYWRQWHTYGPKEYQNRHERRRARWRQVKIAWAWYSAVAKKWARFDFRVRP